MNDLSYNFLIGKFGTLEGRGWDTKIETAVDSLVVGFFTEYLYTENENLDEALDKLIADGKAIGKLGDDIETSCDSRLCSVRNSFRL